MKLRLISLAVAGLFCAYPSHSADWVDDWVDNASYSGAGSFDGQERTYLTGGNISLRHRVRTDYLMTIAPPRFSAGCGGIDAFMGGFAFLDADYLGDKLQSMVTAAPYIAIDMALKSMSKEMSDTLNKAEQIINALNNIQIDECKAMKPVVGMMFGESAEGVTDTWAEMLNVQAIEENTSRFWQESNEEVAANDGKASSSSDLKREVEQCPENVKKLFVDGSLIYNVTKMHDMEDYADLMRGYIGDVSISSTNKVIQGHFVEKCVGNDSPIDGMLFGDGQQKDASGNCSRISTAMYDKVANSIDRLISELENPSGAISPESKRFIRNSNLPIRRMLAAGIQLKQVDEVKQLITEYVALSFAGQTTKDFYTNTYAVLLNFDRALKNPSKEGKKCDLEVYQQAAGQARDLLKSVRELKKEIDDEIVRNANMIATNQAFLDKFRKLESQAKQPTGKTTEE